ncbi:glycosyltransferase [Aliiglaciecola litoralis]|uniref:Glycosyl transferase family 1 domain-containing protein n=1 Tax=Aliiglaciecola litoralis TaxID=582857 RepID=A0ABN1LKA5_9ALTE
MFTKLPSLVIFCPLPPKPNGIADYLAEQLSYFVKKGHICVVIDNLAPDPTNIPASVMVLRLEQYKAQSEQLKSIPHMYHVGNNPDTLYMLPVLLNRPGIVIVHDLNLHYLIDMTNLSYGDKKAYQMALFNQYGSTGYAIGQQMIQYGWKGKHMPEQLLMNESIIDAASEIIVHSQYSANFIGALAHPNVTVIPHHLSPEIRQHQTKLKMNYRGQLGLPGNKVVITSMGFIAKAKQIKAVLASLSELKTTGQDFVYVLAGQCKQHEYDVFQDIADYGLQDEVVVTGFLSNQDFFKYLIASDFIVNLRYPTGGESSGTLTRALGLGLACLVVDIGPFAEIPDDCAVKLAYDDDFQANLTAALAEMIEQPSKRVQIGLNARHWVERTHDITVTTKAYFEVVEREQARLKQADMAHEHNVTKSEAVDANFVCLRYPTEQQAIDFQSQQWMNIEGSPGLHWWKSRYLPLSDNRKLLVLADKNEQGVSQVAQQLFGYYEAKIETQPTTILTQNKASEGLSRFNRFKVLLPAGAIEYDPVAVFANLNRLLNVGAIGCVTVVWDGNQIHPEVDMSREALLTYWQAAGFSVERYQTGEADIDLSLSQSAAAYSQEWAFALVKRSNMVNLTPQPYYNGLLSNLAYVGGSLITKLETEL